MKKGSLLLRNAAVVAIAAVVGLSSCNGNKETKLSGKDSTSSPAPEQTAKPSNLQPKMAKPDWGKDMDDPMAVVIEKLVSFNAPPIVKLSAQEARKNPTPTDAVMEVMKENNIPMPAPGTDTTGISIPVQGGAIHARVYTPKTGKSSYPVIVYYHGGGWVIANLDTYNASAEGLATQADAIVVSVHYRQAPEFKFPTAHMDAYAAYEYVVKNAASMKGDAKKIAVVGESAGGNLAANVSMMARDKNLQLPVYQVLVYPVAGYDMMTPSYKESDSTKPLNNGMMKWFFDKYLRSGADGNSPMISLVNANLKGLPPTTVIAAQYDPLRSEGQTLSDKLKAAGVKTNYKLYEGVNHEFFGMATVLPDAKDAQALAVSDLKSVF